MMKKAKKREQHASFCYNDFMSERNYAELYQKMTQGIKTERDTKRLNFINSCLTWVFYIMYPGLLLDTLFKHREVFLKVLLIPAVTFIVVSLIRAKINEPRPYEVEDIIPLIKKDTKGKSMPSRHVFSAVIISMAYLFQIPWLGIALLVCAACSGFVRILGGVHYPKDVLAGYLVGILCGMLFFVL